MQSSSTQPEQREAGKTLPPTPRRNSSRIERTVWFVLVALPLITYCVVAVLAFSIKPTPINTGDPLYDKYIAWVADDLVNSYNSDYYGRYEQRWDSAKDGANFDPFADWEVEFGDDPRYWMLRYRYSILANDFVYGQRKSELACLDKARELGVVDGAILLTLLNVSDRAVWSQANRGLRSGQNPLEIIASRDKYQRGQVDELMGEEHDQLLAELLEVAGNNSLPHYYAALFDSQRGEFDAAIAHLADGNRAADNSSLVGFPFEKHLAGLQAGKPLSDKLISGSIIMDGQMVSMPNFIHIKNMVKKLVAEAMARDDRAAIDEIHTFACRFGSTQGGDTIAALVGSVLAGIVEAEFNVNFNSPLNPEQRNNILTLGGVRGQVRNQIRAMSVNSPMSNPLTMPLLPRAIWFIGGGVSGGRSIAIGNLEHFHDDFTNEQAVLSSVGLVFEQMESFNYNTLEFE